jgi:general nucleoside transport system permease protein
MSTFAATTDAVRRLTGPRRAGIAGISFALIGAWLALPPVEVRTVAWPAVFAVFAAAAGLWAAARGERKLGWGAVVAGVFALGLGIVAEQSSTANLSGAIDWGALIATTFIFATPVTYAALGGLFAERSGVINIGLEGMLLMGCFFGILGADQLHSWPLGILVAVAAGGVLAFIYAFFAIHLRADQIVGGTAVNFLALGITGYFFIRVYGENGTPESGIPTIPDVNIPGLKHIPPARLGHFLNNAFGHLNLMVWVMFGLLVACYVVMFRTSIGLRIRAVGEHPRAADTVGISVYKTRYAAVTLSGMLAAAGGAYLVAFAGGFQENMTEGRGFIGLAALIFGNWRPLGAFAAALLFGFSSALAQRLQDQFQTLSHPTSGSAALLLLYALPYLLTLIAVAGVIGRSIPPASVGRPYKKQ